MSSRNVITTAVNGLASGTPAFNDKAGIPDLDKTAITEIIVTHDQHIRSLTVGLETLVVRNLLIAVISDPLQ